MTLVLVVDDVAPLAEQYAYDLKRTGGYEVITAGGGELALELLGTGAVDCVVLDLEMPGMDGFDVLRALERKGSQIPVIVYTGTGSFDRCVQALRLGAYGFIDKAEPMERVVHEIETAMERRRLRGGSRRAPAAAGPGDLAPGRQRGDVRAARSHRPGGAGAEPGADHRRERHRQGAGGPRPPPLRAESRRSLRRDQLRRAAGEPGGERAVRPRSRGLHGRRQYPEGRLRGRGARHPVSRRGGGAAARRLRRSCSGCWRSGRSPAWAGPSRSPSKPGSSPPPTATSRPRCAKADSGRTSTSDWRSTPSGCRRSATGSRTSRSWWTNSSPGSARASGSAGRRSPPMPWTC